MITRRPRAIFAAPLLRRIGFVTDAVVVAETLGALRPLEMQRE